MNASHAMTTGTDAYLPLPQGYLLIYKRDQSNLSTAMSNSPQVHNILPTEYIITGSSRTKGPAVVVLW